MSSWSEIRARSNDPLNDTLNDLISRANMSEAVKDELTVSDQISPIRVMRSKVTVRDNGMMTGYARPFDDNTQYFLPLEPDGDKLRLMIRFDSGCDTLPDYSLNGNEVNISFGPSGLPKLLKGTEDDGITTGDMVSQLDGRTHAYRIPVNDRNSIKKMGDDGNAGFTFVFRLYFLLIDNILRSGSTRRATLLNVYENDQVTHGLRVEVADDGILYFYIRYNSVNYSVKTTSSVLSHDYPTSDYFAPDYTPQGYVAGADTQQQPQIPVTYTDLGFVFNFSTHQILIYKDGQPVSTTSTNVTIIPEGEGAFPAGYADPPPPPPTPVPYIQPFENVYRQISETADVKINRVTVTPQESFYNVENGETFTEAIRMLYNVPVGILYTPPAPPAPPDGGGDGTTPQDPIGNIDIDLENASEDDTIILVQDDNDDNYDSAGNYIPAIEQTGIGATIQDKAISKLKLYLGCNSTLEGKYYFKIWDNSGIEVYELGSGEASELDENSINEIEITCETSPIPMHNEYRFGIEYIEGGDNDEMYVYANTSPNDTSVYAFAFKDGDNLYIDDTSAVCCDVYGGTPGSGTGGGGGGGTGGNANTGMSGLVYFQNGDTMPVSEWNALDDNDRDDQVGDIEWIPFDTWIWEDSSIGPDDGGSMPEPPADFDGGNGPPVSSSLSSKSGINKISDESLLFSNSGSLKRKNEEGGEKRKPIKQVKMQPSFYDVRKSPRMKAQQQKKKRRKPSVVIPKAIIIHRKKTTRTERRKIQRDLEKEEKRRIVQLRRNCNGQQQQQPIPTSPNQKPSLRTELPLTLSIPGSPVSIGGITAAGNSYAVLQQASNQNEIVAIQVINTAAGLGAKINTDVPGAIVMYLKGGTQSQAGGILQCKMWNGSGKEIAVFGELDVSELSTVDYDECIFQNVNNTVPITSGCRIGVEYTGESPLDQVLVSRNPNVTDTSIIQSTFKFKENWATNTSYQPAIQILGKEKGEHVPTTGGIQQQSSKIAAAAGIVRVNDPIPVASDPIIPPQPSVKGIVYRGGPVYSEANIYIIFDGNTWNTLSTPFSKSDFTSACDTVFNSTYFDALLQYGIKKPRSHTYVINSTLLLPTTYTIDDVRATIENSKTIGLVPSHIPTTQNNIYIVMAAPGKTFTTPGGFEGANAYNASYWTDSYNKETTFTAYAVNTFHTVETLSRVTRSTFHEMVELIASPLRPNSIGGWQIDPAVISNAGGTEICDPGEGLNPVIDGVTVGAYYSNLDFKVVPPPASATWISCISGYSYDRATQLCVLGGGGNNVGMTGNVIFDNGTTMTVSAWNALPDPQRFAATNTISLIPFNTVIWEDSSISEFTGTTPQPPPDYHGHNSPETGGGDGGTGTSSEPPGRRGARAPNGVISAYGTGEYSEDYTEDFKSGSYRWDFEALGSSRFAWGEELTAYLRSGNPNEDEITGIMGGGTHGDHPKCYNVGIDTITGETRYRMEEDHPDNIDGEDGGTGTGLQDTYVGFRFIKWNQDNGVRIEIWQDTGNNEGSTPANEWELISSWTETEYNWQTPPSDHQISLRTDGDNLDEIDVKWLGIREIKKTDTEEGTGGGGGGTGIDPRIQYPDFPITNLPAGTSCVGERFDSGSPIIGNAITLIEMQAYRQPAVLTGTLQLVHLNGSFQTKAVLESVPVVNLPVSAPSVNTFNLVWQNVNYNQPIMAGDSIAVRVVNVLQGTVFVMNNTGKWDGVNNYALNKACLIFNVNSTGVFYQRPDLDVSGRISKGGGVFYPYMQLNDMRKRVGSQAVQEGSSLVDKPVTKVFVTAKAINNPPIDFLYCRIRTETGAIKATINQIDTSGILDIDTPVEFINTQNDVLIAQGDVVSIEYDKGTADSYIMISINKGFVNSMEGERTMLVESLITAPDSFTRYWGHDLSAIMYTGGKVDLNARPMRGVKLNANSSLIGRPVTEVRVHLMAVGLFTPGSIIRCKIIRGTDKVTMAVMGQLDATSISNDFAVEYQFQNLFNVYRMVAGDMIAIEFNYGDSTNFHILMKTSQTDLYDGQNTIMFEYNGRMYSDVTGVDMSGEMYIGGFTVYPDPQLPPPVPPFHYAHEWCIAAALPGDSGALSDPSIMVLKPYSHCNIVVKEFRIYSVILSQTQLENYFENRFTITPIPFGHIKITGHSIIPTGS